MPQLIEYHAISGKRWEWHLVLFKEWLRVVEEGPTERKYVKWLRARKVFDRGFVDFVERFIGIDHPRKQAPRLNDVALELLEELNASEKRALQVTEKVLERAPGRDMPAPLPPPTGLRGRRGAAELEEVDPESFAPPTAETDPFLKALLDRFTELNPYLSMFVFKQIGDDFMAPGELYRRVGSNDFEGVRPAMPMFNQFLQWLEWLGGLKKVGFRHKATKAGAEVGAFLGSMPLEELLEPDEEPDADEPVTQAPGDDSGQPDGGAAATAETTATARPALPAPSAAPASERALEEQADLPDEDEHGDDLEDEDEDEDEDDLEEEPEEFDDEELGELGLDLPPEAEVAPDAEPFWKAPDPAPRPPSLLELGRELAALRGDAPSPTAEGAAPSSAQAERPAGPEEHAGAIPPPARADAPDAEAPRARGALSGASEAAGADEQAARAGANAAARSREGAGRNGARSGASGVEAARPSSPGRAPAGSPASAPVRGDGAARDALRLAVHWWLDNPPELEPAATSGVSLAPHPSGRPVGVFKLLALATLLEADAAPGAARGLFRALERAGVLEALLLEDAPLERALEVAWSEGAPQALEERLVHLVRYRRGLLALEADALRAGDARDLARALRSQVTGSSLGPGLLFVLRELTAAGQGPASGLDAVAWLPAFPAG